MRRIYDERRQLLFGTLEKDFGGFLTPLRFPAGLHLTALTRSLAEEERIVKIAAQQDVRLAPLRSFYSGRPAKSGLVLGYGAIDNDSMLDALERVRRGLTR